MRVVPVIAPDVDWTSLIRTATDLIGRSPSAPLDAARIPVGTLKSLIPILGEFSEGGVSPHNYLRSRDADRVLEHLAISFLIEAEPEAFYALLALGRLTVLFARGRNDAALVTANVRLWREAILEGCRDAHSDRRPLRLLLGEVIGCFLRAGLADVLNIQAKPAPDGTFTLALRH